MIYFTSNNVTENILETDIKICSIKFIKEYFKNSDLVGVDTETTGFNPHVDKVLTLQLGNKKDQFVIDVSTIDILEFKDILETKELILQNAKFDLRFFYKKDIWPNKIYDTFLAEVKLTQGILNHKRNLEALAKEYCKTEEVDKSLRSLINYEGLSPAVIKYAANDVKFLHEIREKQLIKATKQEVTLGIHRENRFVPCLAYAEFCGMYFNTTMWIKKVDKALDKVIYFRNKLNDFIIINNISKYIDKQLDLFTKDKKVLINWNSDQQVKPLFKDLGINILVYEKGVCKESIEAGVLKKQEHISEIIPIYLNYKKWEKDATTYGYSFIEKISKETGRIHTNFTQIVNTGRMASGGRNRATKEAYPNFQNIPATPDKKKQEEGMVYARQCITPEKDNVFVNADYSGQEQIVLVNKSKDKDLLAFYESNLGDMHSFMASKIYPELANVSLNDIKKYHHDKRQIAKSAGFALNYGGTGYTIATNLSLPQEEGDRIEKAYFEAFPGLQNYYKKCEELTLKNGYITIDDVTGDKFYIAGFDKLKQLILEQENRPKDYWKTFYEEKSKNSKWFKEQVEKNAYINRWKGQIKRLSLNTPIQGTSASITKIACIYLYDWLIENKYQNIVKIVNIIHDEILTECPKELSKIVAEKMKEFMERAGDIYCKLVPLKAVPEISTYWNH